MAVGLDSCTAMMHAGQGFGSFDFVMPPLTKHEGWLKPPKNNLRRKIPAPFPFMQLPPDIRANILKLFKDALVPGFGMVDESVCEKFEDVRPDIRG